MTGREKINICKSFKTMKKVILSLVLVIAINSSVFSQVIPDDRRIIWSPGIPGGIPEIKGPVANVVDFGADITGQKDSHQAFSKAMNSLPESGGVLSIPSGTYRIDSSILVKKSNIVFRGDPANVPRLLSYAKGNSIEIRAAQTGTWQKLLSGYDKNSKAVRVENASDFRSYHFAEIQQENDPLLMYTNPEWKQGWSENSVGQIFQVDSITNNTIFLKNSLNISFTAAQKPMIRPVEMVINSGFENLYIEKMVPKDHTFHFENTAFCWMRGVESYHTRRTHVSIAVSYANEIRESYFHHSFDYGGGGSGYGVECRMHTTGTLVENNIFDSLRHAMLVQTGANANVYAYNYSVNPVQGEGETNLNKGWIPPDISIHGHYTFMNLFEGNYVSEIGIADYWGPAGPGNTFFRNRVIDEGIFFYDATHMQNVVGNETTAITDRDKKGKDNIIKANVVNNEPVSPVPSLPGSLYLNETPSFLKGYKWPFYGPDVTGKNKLPAQVRYEEMVRK